MVIIKWKRWGGGFKMFQQRKKTSLAKLWVDCFLLLKPPPIIWKYRLKVMRFIDFKKLCDCSFSSAALGAACGVAFGFAPASPLKSPLASRAFCSWARCSLRLLSRSWRDGWTPSANAACSWRCTWAPLDMKRDNEFEGTNWMMFLPGNASTNIKQIRHKWRGKTTDLWDHHITIAQDETTWSWPTFNGKALIVKRTSPVWMLQVNTPGSHDWTPDILKFIASEKADLAFWSAKSASTRCRKCSTICGTSPTASSSAAHLLLISWEFPGIPSLCEVQRPSLRNAFLFYVFLDWLNMAKV